jgi:hypothetical protein
MWRDGHGTIEDIEAMRCGLPDLLYCSPTEGALNALDLTNPKAEESM